MSAEEEIPPEMRTCQVCSTDFEHFPMMVEGRDLAAHMHTCPTCMDAVENEANSATREAKAKARWEKIVPEGYRLTDISHEDYPTRHHQAVLNWSRGGKADARHDRKLALGLIGPTGRCKTRLMAQAIKRKIWAGDWCEWVNTSNFAWCCRSQWHEDKGRQAQAWLRKFRDCDFLALDDLGKGKLTETIGAELFDLLEHRTSHLKPFIWSANATLEEFEKLLTTAANKDRAKPIVGRLAEFSNILSLK